MMGVCLCVRGFGGCVGWDVEDDVGCCGKMFERSEVWGFGADGGTCVVGSRNWELFWGLREGYMGAYNKEYEGKLK